MPRVPFVFVLVTVVGTLGWSSTALAQAGEVGVGVLASKVDTPITSATPIAVEFEDDTGLNERLKKHIESALKRKGYTVAGRAETRLVFDTDITAEASITSGIVPPIGNIQRDNTDGLRLVIPGVAEGQSVKGTTFQLQFSLQRSGVPPLWTGAAYAVARKADWFRVTRGMATYLVEALGTTVKSRKFVID